ncbi:hypothetical protein [Collinsella tanakaei]|uniref:hypothetical protein n=1 Tax=Collinsella tanakaei TaxID=626935 RepID=UPI001EF5C26C|nr:hypothetical protein [Collinsella tanakaei]
MTDEAEPSLLFDDVVNSDNTEGAGAYRTALRDRATEVLHLGDIDKSRLNFQERYLDLVDANNANVWLRASEDVTAYWPYPEGTDSDTEFRLVHLEGLHREMGTDDVIDSIESANAVEVDVTKTPDGIRFTTDGFSPFVLVWTSSEEPDTPDTPDKPGDPGNPDDPDDPDTPDDPYVPDNPTEPGQPAGPGEPSGSIPQAGDVSGVISIVAAAGAALTGAGAVIWKRRR